MGVLERKLKEETILKAAASVFAAIGLGGTKMSDIAKKAGISKASLYFYYQNKDDLYMALIHQICVMHIEFYQRVVQENSNLNGLEKSMALIEAYFGFIEQHRTYLDILSNYLTLVNPVKQKITGQSVTSGMKESKYYAQICEIQHLPSFMIVQLIETGKKDGSIKSDSDPQLLYATIWALLIGYEKLYLPSDHSETQKKGPVPHHVDFKTWQAMILHITKQVLISK